MKRTHLVLIVFLLLLPLVGIFHACSTESTVSKYTCTERENGVSYTYILTVDEKKQTFSIERDPYTEYAYTGSYIDKNGYLILQSEEKGTQYVRLYADEFSFFSPTPETPVCEHTYEYVETVPGTCSSVGYKRYVCSRCQAEKTENTTYGDHAFVRRSFTEGTCQKKSLTLYECSYCGKIREVEGEYGDHTWVRDNDSEDKGCLIKKSVTRHCSTDGCTATELVEVSDEYGSHSYDENGVCRYCLFDRNGLCHEHTDAEEDGECDTCKMNVAALNGIRRDGYYYDGETLYFGAYPTEEFSDVNTILSEGKLDPVTGYYRYNNASYLVKTKENLFTKTTVTKAFRITYLTWTKVSSSTGYTTFKCNSVLHYKPYIYGTLLSDGYHADDPMVTANDWQASTLFSFANTEFLFTAFSERQRELFYGSPRVDLPSSALPDLYRKTSVTDYAKFDLDTNSSDLYFTLSPDEDRMKVWCLHGNSNESAVAKNVTMEYGFVPFVILNIEIE